MPTAESPDLNALLDACAARGVRVALGDNGTLKVRAPAGALTAELQTRLKAHKADLIHLLEARENDDATNTPIPPRPAGRPAALSSAQARLWFLNQLDPRSIPAYNIVAAVRIRGPLQSDALRAAVDALAVRHETLRTAFGSIVGEPQQEIAETVAVPFATEDRSNEPAHARETAITAALRREAERPFDLTRAPLLRTTLLRFEAQEHVFIFTIHHLVSDGWSSGVIIRDLAALYEAATAGRVADLPALRTQFADYAAWQADRLATPAAAADLDYWKTTLANPTVLNLPTDHPRPPAMTFAGDTVYETFAPTLADSLESLAQTERATLFQVLLAAFQVLLSRYTGQTDIAVGTSIANRTHPDLDPLIGFLTNTLVMRTDLGGNPAFSELLARTRRVATDAYAHAETPLERIIEELQPERSMSQNPLFQVCFSLLQAHRDTLRLGDGLTLEQLNANSATARFDLTVTVEHTRAGLLVAVEYSRDLFEPGTIRRLLDHYRTLLEAITAAPVTPIGELPLLTPADRHTLLHDWNNSATPYPRDACITDLFAETVRRHAAAPAVKAGNRQLTYGELDLLSNQLAHRLREHGVTADVPVAVCAERSLAMIVSLVAVLKAGGQYLPFDPGDPLPRLQQIFAQATPGLLLAPASIVGELPDFGLSVYPVDLDNSGLRSAPATPPDLTITPEHLAYTTFTSGSTGQPKGICIPHRGVVRLVRDTNYLDYTPDLRILELAPVSFDASTFEIWGALCNGALLVVWRPGPPSIRELADTIEQEGITTLYLTSALFNLMVDERVGAFAGVRHLLVGGDIISAPHARRLLAAHPQLTLINGYGPTETTTFASCGMLRQPDDVGHSVTIGPPMSNTTLYLLDEHFEPVPVGIPGDLYIGGDGNARGYLGRPDLTAESFVPNPHARTPGERLYRTGDLARWAPDGTVEFLGRRDFQVKVRGFRIELGEIEAALVAHPAIEKALVLVVEDRPGDKRLIGCVQTEPGATAPADDELVTHLTARLPDFMIPAAFLVVEQFPLNAHGKIDRQALGERASTSEASPGTPYEAPRDPVEDAVAGVWSGVLGAERIGRRDSFFDLGGHSLLATQVMWRLYEIFGVELPLRWLFERPTLSGFAAALVESVDRSSGRPGRALAIARVHLQVRDLPPEAVARLLAAKRGGSGQDQ